MVKATHYRIHTQYIEVIMNESEQHVEPQAKSTEMMLRMFQIAKKEHAGQRYGDKGDYFQYHIIGVLDKLQTLPEFKSALPQEQYDMILMTIGHDLIEDTDVTEQYLLDEGFSVDVAHGISLLSRDKETPKDVYINRILESFRATTVKKADTEFNYEHSIADGNERLIAKYTEQRQALKKNDDIHKRRLDTH